MSSESTKKLMSRPPIVVVMGHVDHGKTTLLDYIRKTNIAGKEAGGITQSVGAYEIEHPSTHSINSEQASSPRASSGKVRKITFIDTPGHEAFSHMRARGATIADLAVLVIAAEEGIKPQTKEAIAILKETKTPFIVAINKIDRPEANVEKTKQDLATAGVFLEGFGGQVSYQPISAKKGDGVNELLDLILLTADMENLSYDPTAETSGYILESRIDQRCGLEVTAIITNGTLKSGEVISTPTSKGKIKILQNFLGKPAKELFPSAPALIIGFEALPKNGEIFTTGTPHSVPENTRRTELRAAASRGSQTNTAEKDEPVLKLILKASDVGCLEAFSAVINDLKVPHTLVILDESVGDVSDGDVKMAIASKAAIVGFRVRTHPSAKNLAEAQEVRIITSEIIYELMKAIEEFLAKPDDLSITGELEVLALFNQKKLEKQVVGGKTTRGTIRNKAAVEIMRGNETIGRGKITNLEQQKKEVNQVGEGNECGLLVYAGIAIQIGDRLVMKK